jgi:quinol-cytochrome oxidoreductase complex cytochrome b subunit
MKRGTLLYWIAVSALLAFLLQVFSGFVLWLAIPRGDGFRGGRQDAEPPGQEEFLALTRGDWIDIHQWAAVALLVIIGVHLILQWRWIVSLTKRIFAGA